MFDQAEFVFDDERPPINPCMELFDVLPVAAFEANWYIMPVFLAVALMVAIRKTPFQNTLP